MKESEKLDFILRSLYDKPDKTGELIEILRDIGLDADVSETERLSNYLEELHYVQATHSRMGIMLQMKSVGVMFVEKSSFSREGQSIVNHNYTISDSPNTNIVSYSSNVTITQQNHLNQTLRDIKEAVGRDETVDNATRQEVIDCVEEVEDGIGNGKTPKFALKSLIEIASNIASIASLAAQLVGLPA